MITIIGGTGFIGKHLCELIHKSGKTAITISRKPDEEFLRQYAPSIKGFAINDRKSFSPYLKKSKILVYLASNTTPATDSTDFDVELSSNILPAIRFFNLALKVNANLHIVYISSGGTVYGPGHTSPIKESSPTNPNSLYAYGKIATEEYLKYLSNNGRMTYTILRVSNPVGKWNNNALQGFITVSLNNIYNNAPIKLYVNGDTIRDYISANDLAKAIFAIFDQGLASTNKIWNVGSGIGHSLNELLEIMRSITGRSVRVVRKENITPKISYCVLDSTIIYNDIRWRAKTGIEQMILETWKGLNEL